MIGYQCSNNRNNNVGMQHRRVSKRPSVFQNEHMTPSKMGGNGIMDIARSILATGATALAVGSAVKNA